MNSSYSIDIFEVNLVPHTFTLSDPNLSIPGFFSVLLARFFLLSLSCLNVSLEMLRPTPPWAVSPMIMYCLGFFPAKSRRLASAL